MIHKVRCIEMSELKDLLELYTYLNQDAPELEINDTLKKLWEEILNDPDLYYLAVKEDGKLISSCTLAIIKNLTRGAKPYGVIENVVTHPDYRNKGYATAVLHKAVKLSRERDCYKVMLMTGRKEESTLLFYEKAGFEKGKKTAFIKYLDR